MSPIILPPLSFSAELEQVVLDGLALNTLAGPLLLELLDFPPPRKRLEWAQSADGDGAALVRDPLFDNREITVKVRVAQQASMNLALDQIASVVTKLEECEQQEDGLPLQWSPAGSTRTVTFYVLSGEITDLPVRIDEAWFVRAPGFTIRMTAKPHAYGTEVVGSASSSTLPLMTVTVAGVTGDAPAEGRLIVTDAATKDRGHVEWGLESRHLNAATSLLLTTAAGLTNTGLAGTSTTRAGSYSTNVFRGTLATSAVAVCGTTTQAHVGTFRVKARVWASDTTVRARLAWRVGDGQFSRNVYATPPAAGAWSEIDLGIVTVPTTTLGTQKWTGRVEAYGAGGSTIDVDILELVPASEGYGVAKTAITELTAESFIARDEFDQASGSLSGQVLPVGGSWASGGAGSDFTVNSTSHVAIRSTISDSAPQFALAGTSTPTSVVVGADIATAVNGAGAPRLGVVARYVSTTSYLAAYVEVATGGAVTINVVQVVSGVTTVLGSKTPPAFVAGQYGSIRLQVDTAGRWALWHVVKGSAFGSVPLLSGASTSLATGGALASGKVGLYDYNSAGIGVSHLYDNFYAWVPIPDAAIFSTQSLEVRHDQTLREDSTGTYWGKPWYRGSRFLLPPAGDESRTSRIAVKGRRNDVTQFPDDNVADNLTVQVNYTPRYLVVPR